MTWEYILLIKNKQNIPPHLPALLTLLLGCITKGIFSIWYEKKELIYNKTCNVSHYQYTISGNNRRRLTVFSYSGRVKSPEWRWLRRRADLWHFEIFRHGLIIIYTRLPAGGTYCPICMFLASRVFDRHFWCPFCLLFTGIRHLPHVLTVPPTKACLLCATPTGMDQCSKALTECSPLDFRRPSIRTSTEEEPIYIYTSFRCSTFYERPNKHKQTKQKRRRSKFNIFWQC